MLHNEELKTKLFQFISDQLSVPKERITLDTDILNGFGVDGDDVTEFMESFSKAYNIDLENFRWYHHGGPEGCNPFWFIIRPWWARKTYIPVTPRLLIECIQSGKWEVEYPEHEKEN